MIEYKLNIPAKHSTIKAIWRKFLKDDSTWHFTLEGDYIELRVAKKRKDLEAYFKLKKWDFSSFEYEDNIPITRKYQKQFEKIFHGFAELAMNVKRGKTKEDDYAGKGDLKKVFERCIHLFCNLNNLDWRDEFQWASSHALDRAYYLGYTIAKEEEKKIKTDKEG